MLIGRDNSLEGPLGWGVAATQTIVVTTAGGTSDLYNHHGAGKCLCAGSNL